MAVADARRVGRWILALSPLMSVLMVGCAPRVTAPAEALAGPTPVRAEPLALLVLTPGMLPRLDRVPTDDVQPTVHPTPSLAPQQRATTPPPSPMPSATLATLTPTPASSPLATATPTSSPMAIRTPTSSPTATSVPWPAADTPPDRIVAPAIGLDAAVVQIGWHLAERNGQMVSEWDVADQAAGFHKGSAYPGQVGNTVLSGHHNIRGEVFRHLIELQAGDLVSLHVGNQEYRYTVQEVLLLPEKNVSPDQRRENARWIGYFPEERLTLVTCWPYTGNTHRVIVIACPVGKGM